MYKYLNTKMKLRLRKMLEKDELILNYIDSELESVSSTVNSKLTKKGIKLNTRLELNEIKKQIDNFIDEKYANRFIVMPGLRGVGKTTVLYQTYEYLFKEKNIPLNNILYISCDELNDIAECSIRELVEIYLKNKFNKNIRTLNEKVFLLIDEAQYDKNWAVSNKIIFDKSDHIFMIITGSSAIHLQYNADAARRLKRRILTPLNYNQHLKLKYNKSFTNLSRSLYELLFTGNIENAVEYEFESNKTLTNIVEYNSNEWDYYLKYGGFPTFDEEKPLADIHEEIVTMTNKIITEDIMQIRTITSKNQAIAKRIIRQLALQNPGEISQHKLSSYLKTSLSNINNILDLLEKTELIFHCEPFGGSSRRLKKAWKYYFASSSIRHALSTKVGNTMKNSDEYEGILIENLVASNLFNLSNTQIDSFNIYYDPNKEKNVDFVIQDNFENPIPIEVGRGKKKKGQIKNAMNRYDSQYGIVVANNKKTIKKVGDVIFIPPRTFSFL